MMESHLKFLSALVSLCCSFPSVLSSGHPCSALRKMENGQTFFRYGGLFATFSCHHGYRLHGHRTNSCVSGRWTREPPLCVGSGCPPPSPVARGSFRVNSDASWVDFSCDSGYKLVGPSRLYCKGHEWSSSPPLCEEPDLMHSTTFGVTAQKPCVNQTLQTAEDLKDTTPSHHKATILPETIYLNMSNSSNKESTPALTSSKNPDPPELQTLLIPEKHIPISGVTASFKLLSTSLASTLKNETTKATTVLPSLHLQSTFTRPSPLYTTTSPGIRNKDQHVPQSPMSTESTIPQAFATVTAKNMTLSNLHSSPTSRSTTVSDRTFQNTAPSSHTEAGTTQKPVHQSPTSMQASWKGKSTSVTCPLPPTPAHGTFYFRNNETPGQKESGHYSIQYVCDHGFALENGNAVRFCQEGATWSGTAPDCVDVDECALPTALNGCLFGCVNVPGSFYCLCPPGYTLLSPEHTFCQDIDECVDNGGLGPCSEQCHNTPGSFHCSCSYGSTLAGDGVTCIPECPKGYRKQPRTPQDSTLPSAGQCVDINECEDEDSCEWKCINSPGTYRCICPRGHILSQDGRGCRDIDECSNNNGGCSHICLNLKGSFKCACPPSHRFAAYSWKKCVPRVMSLKY